jgi:acyl dehydratase
VLNDFEQAAGTHRGHSDWHTITQERINFLAEAIGDHHWIHTDPERAAKGPFGIPSAHGYLKLSLVPMLVWEIRKVESLRIGVNYGSNKVRFSSSVSVVGSRIRAEVELFEFGGALWAPRQRYGSKSR